MNNRTTVQLFEFSMIRLTAKAFALALLLGISLFFAACSESTPDTPDNTDIEMVFIQGGEFNMGSISGEADEQPVHTVTISSFSIGKYEVTQKEWIEVMGNNPSHFQGNSFPVETVSWFDAVNFCNQKSTRSGLTPVYTINGTTVTIDWNASGYRLPTEAEWEYAARGGSSSNGYLFSGSNTLNDAAWNADNALSTTHSKGTKAANEIGVFDMSGNVWEWCSDWYDNGYYSYSPTADPKGSDVGEYKSLRGGAWNSAPSASTVSYRNWFSPTIKDNTIGFRVVKKQ